MISLVDAPEGPPGEYAPTPIDVFLQRQQTLTPVDRFAAAHPDLTPAEVRDRLGVTASALTVWRMLFDKQKHAY